MLMESWSLTLFSNAGQKLWQKLGNPAGLNTILNILLPSNIIPAPLSPNIDVDVIAHSQTNTSRTTLKLGEGGSSEMSPFLLTMPDKIIWQKQQTVYS